jgi:hypothetical protein
MHAAERLTMGPLDRLRARPPRRTRGTTLIELMVVFSVMLVAVSIFYQMVLSTKRLRVLNHENAVAVEAARCVIERMRNEDFDEVFELYNADPSDDPDGAGTAPGNRFAVPGLEPLGTADDGLIGEVILPAVLVEEPAAGGGEVGGMQQVGGGGGGGAVVPPEPEWQLREDFVDAELGMPRDLSGDSIIDEENHSADYLILPIRIRMSWEGVYGNRTLDLYTMVGEFRRP